MTREIKFRAWSNYDKNFICDDEYMIGLDGKFYRMDYYGGISGYEDGNLIWNELKNITLSQFTGLKDKEGKEIYEGDIVDLGVDFDTVIFSYGMFILEKMSACYCRGVPLAEYCHQITIKGNIFENPELLEE